MFQMKVSSHLDSHPAMITALDLVGPPQYTASVGSHFSTTQASEQYPSTTQSCLLPCPPLLSEVPQSALLLRTHSNDTRVKPAPLSSPTVETKPSSHSFLCDAVTTRPPELASSEAASIKLNPVIPHALQVVSPSTSSMYTHPYFDMSSSLSHCKESFNGIMKELGLQSINDDPDTNIKVGV